MGRRWQAKTRARSRDKAASVPGIARVDAWDDVFE
jgi:hypothetical protein